MPIKKILRRLIEPIFPLIARSVVDELLFRATTDKIQGTVSLRPVDVRQMASIMAGVEAANFYSIHLYNAAYFDSYVDHVREMARRAAQSGPGAILEFGVASGTTLTAIANAANRPVVGFDSFKGLPADWRDGVRKGAFAGKPPELPSNASLQIGMIEETLPPYLASMQEREIRFLHIDTDLYAPAKVILTLCRPYMNETVIVFDEFLNYPGWRDHEYKAFTEFLAETDGEFTHEYIGLGGQVAVSALLRRRDARHHPNPVRN